MEHPAAPPRDAGDGRKVPGTGPGEGEATRHRMDRKGVRRVRE